MNAALRPGRQHYGLTLAVLLVAALAFALQQTMVAPALPAIQEELGTSTTTVTFVLTGFLLTASVSTPIIGRLGDMFGKERMLVDRALGLRARLARLRALALDRGPDRRPRDPGHRRGAVFPLSFGIIRDEFPRRARRDGHRPDQRHVRHRRRRRARAQRRDRRPPRLRVDLLARPRADRRRDRRDVPLGPRVADQEPGEDRLERRRAAVRDAGRLLVGVSEANSWGWSSPRDPRAVRRRRSCSPPSGSRFERARPSRWSTSR